AFPDAERWSTVANCGGNLARLEAVALADQHERDAPGDLFVLDDQDLAALALGPAAGVVVAAAGDGARRALLKLAAFLHRRGIADALERGGEVGHQLVHAGDQDHLVRAERVAGKAVAAAVDVHYFAGHGDGVDASHEPLGRGRLPTPPRALLALVGRGDRRPQPVVIAAAERIEEPNFLQRRRAAVHDARIARNALEDQAQRFAAVGGVNQRDATRR